MAVGRRSAPEPRTIERALLGLGRVRTLSRLGEHGPLQAAVGEASQYSGALFGRDTLVIALDLLEDFPRVAQATLAALAEWQGTRIRKRSEEEPGRILHEHRFTDAHRNPRWGYPYYGTVDASCLFVRLGWQYVQRYGPGVLGTTLRRHDGRGASIGQALNAAVEWIERRLDQCGFLYVQRSNPYGLESQVWPDSYDAFSFEDGRLLDPDLPYAPVTVQGLAYDALVMGAELTDSAAAGARWRARADRLRRDVLGTMWLPREGTFGLAVQLAGPDRGRVANVVASDPGHLLATGLLDGADVRRQREAVRDRLLAPDMLAGAGIRTKSVSAPRFNPGAYHNGSVWPMDNGVVIDGFRRHGYTREADELEERLLRAVASVGTPVEFFRGDTDDQVRLNTRRYVAYVAGAQRSIEQPPETIQGWTASLVWRIMRRRRLIAT